MPTPSVWAPILESLPQGVLLVAPGGRVLEANGASCRILGRAREDLLAPGFLATWEGASGPAWLASEAAVARLFRLSRPDGASQWLEVATAALPEGAILATFTDATDRLDAEGILAAHGRIVALAGAATLEQVLRATLDEAEQLTDSRIGFYHFLEGDQRTLTLKAWSTATVRDYCHAIGEDTHYPLEQAGIWADAIRERCPQIHNDYASQPFRQGLPHGHAELIRELVVPVLRGDRIVAILGVGNKASLYGARDMAVVQRLAELAWDIADHKRTQEFERFEKAALESSLSAVALADPEGRIRYVNPAYVTLRGHADRPACLGTSLWAFWADPAEAQDLARRLAEAGAPIEGDMEALRRDGTPFDAHFTVSIAQSSSGRPLGLLGTFLDVTRRKEIEQELKESEFFFKESQRAAAIGSYSTDFIRGTWNSSPVLDQIFGIDDTFDRTVQAWLSIIHPDDLDMMARYMDEAIIAERRPFAKEYRIVRVNDGETRWVHGLGEVAFDGEGNLLSMMGTIQDITPRRKAEVERDLLLQQLQHSQKMESLGSLAGGVAHDMNNVLGAILALASVNLLTYPKDSPVHLAFDTIAEAATRGGKMVKSLLSFARKSPVEEKTLALNSLLLEQVRLLERVTLSKVRMELGFAEDLRPVLGDGSALTNAFMNLCINAVDAMPEGGTLRVLTRNIDSHWVEVLVEDTGTGMSKEVLDRALDPFFTTKGPGKGTGLGLAMVYSAVKAHRGQLDIQSHPGLGTTVRLRFPAQVTEEAVPPAAPEPGSDPLLGHLKALLVDDDDLVMRSTQMLFAALGIQAETAASGEAALALLEAGLRPDVVILDMNMPGLGGAGTLPRLRALCPDVPVLLATGRADDLALDLAGQYLNVTLFPKPFSFGDLKSILGPLGRPVHTP